MWDCVSQNISYLTAGVAVQLDWCAVLLPTKTFLQRLLVIVMTLQSSVTCSSCTHSRYRNASNLLAQSASSNIEIATIQYQKFKAVAAEPRKCFLTVANCSQPSLSTGNHT